MATTRDSYLSTRSGNSNITHTRVHIPKGERGAYLAAFQIGSLLRKNRFPVVGMGLPYVAAQWTVDTAGTGGAIAEATTAGGGILGTVASDANFNWSLQSKQIWTPAAAKRVSCWARLQVSNATGIGFMLGLGNSNAASFDTDFTDKVCIQKAITSANVVGSIIGNADTERNTGTLGVIVAATEIEVGFEFIIGSSATVGTSGRWCYNGTWTAFTAAQLAQAYLLLTSPQSMYATINLCGVTGTNPTATITSFICEVDN